MEDKQVADLLLQSMPDVDEQKALEFARIMREFSEKMARSSNTLKQTLRLSVRTLSTNNGLSEDMIMSYLIGQLWAMNKAIIAEAAKTDQHKSAVLSHLFEAGRSAIEDMLRENPL